MPQNPSELIPLPAATVHDTVPVGAALRTRRSVRAFAPDPLAVDLLAQLLWAAQGITSPDGRRTAPSAGATYPLEVLVVVGAVDGLAAGIYRYRPREHALVLVAAGDVRDGLARAASGEQDWMARAPAALVLAAVPRRTEGRYGARAERYVHIEVGAAAENVYLQAAALGLGTTLVGAFDDEAVGRLLRLARDEGALAVLPVGVPRR